MQDSLILSVEKLRVDVLTGIYSHETDLPQPLEISVHVGLKPAEHYGDDTPMAASKNYMDIKHAASSALPEGVHFSLIEGVADHIADTLFVQDSRVDWVEVKIVKLAISQHGEAIGITMRRHRK